MTLKAIQYKNGLTMSDIKQLEKELEIAKKKDLKEKWEVYLDTLKRFLDNLKGKTIIQHYRNGGFNLYKVIGYKEQYYADREGFNGQWSPCRWIEIQTSSYITCRVADDRGRWYRGGIEHEGSTTFKAITYKGKSLPKELEMSKIEYNDSSIANDALSTISRSVKIGFTEYEEYREDPNYSRALEPFMLFTQIAPEGMWEEAKAIADDNLIKTKKFWERFQPECNKLKPLYSVIPFK